jgi:hypothetical protein
MSGWAGELSGTEGPVSCGSGVYGEHRVGSMLP